MDNGVSTQLLLPNCFSQVFLRIALFYSNLRFQDTIQQPMLSVASVSAVDIHNVRRNSEQLVVMEYKNVEKKCILHLKA